MADLQLEDFEEDLIEPENIPPQIPSPQNETSVKEDSELPQVNEDVEAISRSCIALLNDMCLPPTRRNSGVYIVCNNLLQIQHSTAIEYAKQYDGSLATFESFKDNMLNVAKSIHNDGALKSFSNYVSVLGSLEGNNDRIIGGGFHDRISVLASIITFIVRSSYQVSEFRNTPDFCALAEETYDKYQRYQSGISKLNIPGPEKSGLAEWLGLYFPKELISAWASSTSPGQQSSL